MTRESNLWRRVSAEIKRQAPRAHAVRIENSAELGTPDVNVCNHSREVWVELKVAEKPKRAATCVRVKHFSLEQRRWHADRAKSAGMSFILLQVDRELFLFRGDVAAVGLGTWNMAQLAQFAIATDLKKIVHRICFSG